MAEKIEIIPDYKIVHKVLTEQEERLYKELADYCPHFILDDYRKVVKALFDVELHLKQSEEEIPDERT